MIKRWIKRIIVAGLVMFVGLPLVFFLVFRFVPLPITSFMVIGSVNGLLEDKPYSLRHDWVPLEEISPNLQRAVMASEDQKFPDHWGFDIDALQSAFAHNKRNGRIRGGSTISQQTAKNIFLWSGRSYVRKGIEAWLTLMMEATWDKHRIIEVYLNSAEFGRGIYGAEAASQFWFHKSARKLTAREAALLAASLPSPRRFNPSKPSRYMNARAGWIQRQMGHLGAVAHAFSRD